MLNRSCVKGAGPRADDPDMTVESVVRPAPTAVVHPVAPDELFFSTTDRRGVIRSANSVFVRISKYDLQLMLGRPHNIVRHPSMPSGAFHLMWERLLAGKPMAAYVRNMSADGGTYWVFATVTPFEDGFLSVRGAPMTTLFDTVRDVYDVTIGLEQEFAAAGHHRGEVARYGAGLIEQAVRTLDYPSYEAFMFDALAFEVDQRRRIRPVGMPRPADAGRAGEVLDAVDAMEHALDSMDRQVASYAELARQLGPASQDMVDSARVLEEVAGHAESVSESAGVGVLVNTARVSRAPMRDAITALGDVAGDLDEVLHATRRERFSISLARLHAEMAGAFAQEAVDGLAPSGSLGEVPALCRSMSDDVDAMLDGSERLHAQLRAIADRIDETVELTDRFGYFVGEWKRVAVRKIPGVPLGPVLGPIEEHLAVGRDRLAVLRRLADDCRTATSGFDVGRFTEPLARARQASAEVG